MSGRAIRPTRLERVQAAWYFVTAAVIGLFGPIFMLGSVLATAEPARLTLDLLSWPIDGMQDFRDDTTRFLSALTGGFLFGWGLTILAMRLWVYPIASEPTRRVVLIGLVGWFALDSLGSALSGNPSNVLFNVAVLLTAAGPLWVSAARHGSPTPEGTT